eukprot:8930-Pelagococcus_subviridis.AAC.6
MARRVVVAAAVAPPTSQRAYRLADDARPQRAPRRRRRRLPQDDILDHLPGTRGRVRDVHGPRRWRRPRDLHRGRDWVANERRGDDERRRQADADAPAICADGFRRRGDRAPPPPSRRSRADAVLVVLVVLVVVARVFFASGDVALPREPRFSFERGRETTRRGLDVGNRRPRRRGRVRGGGDGDVRGQRHQPRVLRAARAHAGEFPRDVHVRVLRRLRRRRHRRRRHALVRRERLRARDAIRDGVRRNLERELRVHLEPHERQQQLVRQSQRGSDPPRGRQAHDAVGPRGAVCGARDASRAAAVGVGGERVAAVVAERPERRVFDGSQERRGRLRDVQEGGPREVF